MSTIFFPLDAGAGNYRQRPCSPQNCDAPARKKKATPDGSMGGPSLVNSVNDAAAVPRAGCCAPNRCAPCKFCVCLHLRVPLRLAQAKVVPFFPCRKNLSSWLSCRPDSSGYHVVSASRYSVGTVSSGAKPQQEEASQARCRCAPHRATANTTGCRCTYLY